MAWDRTQPSDPKYKTKQHRQYRQLLLTQLQRDGYLTCTARVCVFTDRTITDANGNHDAGLNAGHADNGIDYDGPQHRLCNVKDGARRARARQENPERWKL